MYTNLFMAGLYIIWGKKGKISQMYGNCQNQVIHVIIPLHKNTNLWIMLI